MQPKIIILDWSVTGLHPILKFRRSLDNLILNASGIFEASPASYPVMIEDSIIAGRYAYDMSALTLNDGEYSYPVFVLILDREAGYEYPEKFKWYLFHRL